MRRHVLIIEDTHAIVAALRAEMMVEGYRVSTASNGLGGLVAAEADRPDAIVLDIRMPDIDGFEVCRRLKANPALADVPVVFISANNVETARAGALAAGGAAFVRKPFDPMDVVSAIDEHCPPLGV